MTESRPFPTYADGCWQVHRFNVGFAAEVLPRPGDVMFSGPSRMLRSSPMPSAWQIGADGVTTTISDFEAVSIDLRALREDLGALHAELAATREDTRSILAASRAQRSVLTE